MFYTAIDLERLDRCYFVWPPGWHTVKSKCGKYTCSILVVNGRIKEMLM